MAVAAKTPITGVAANKEATLETVFPSVANTVCGKIVAAILGPVASVPLVPLRLLVYIVLGALAAPIGAIGYVLQKLLGNYFEITTRSVKERRIIGGQLIKEASLSDIAEVQVVLPEGSNFHRVGDVELLNSQGNRIFSVPAIPYPNRLANVINEAREARLRADESLKQIQSRRS